MSYMNSLCEAMGEQLNELGLKFGIGARDAEQDGRAYFFLAVVSRAAPGDRSIAKYEAQVARLRNLCGRNVPTAALETWSYAVAELHMLRPSHNWTDEEVAEELSGEDLLDWTNRLLHVAYLHGVSASLFDSGVSSSQVLSELGRLGAESRHRIDSDGKQAAKAFVRDCWEDWEAEPTQYKSSAAFARSMLDKFPGVLTSQPVIEGWVRGWRSNSPRNNAESSRQ